MYSVNLTSIERKMAMLIARVGNRDSYFQSLCGWLKDLPPFWIAFALTLTETVGAGTLALPIAFASVGPLVGVALLIILGLINLLTVSYLAEASARNPSIRSGNGFIGKLVEDYLGTYASLILRVSLFLLCCIFLTAYYTGFASILSAATGIPAPIWVTVVFIFGLILTLRKTLTGTLAAALITGAVNISILLLISGIALRHASIDNFLHMNVPGINGQEFDSSHIKLVFGVILVSYFGHLSVSNCAKTVLERDPSGRSLKRGTVAAMLVAILIYCIWTVSVSSAVGSENLIGETGTALIPLANKVGPSVYMFGVVFAVLGLGMSSVHFGLGIVNLSKELFSSKDSDPVSLKIQNRRAVAAATISMFGVFLYVQWTYFTGTSSFTAPLELIGALLTPVLAGIFPVLLLIASRKHSSAKTQASLPGVASNFWMLASILTVFIASLLLHAFVLWVNPVAQFAALFVAVVMFMLIVDTLWTRPLDVSRGPSMSLMLK